MTRSSGGTQSPRHHDISSSGSSSSSSADGLGLRARRLDVTDVKDASRLVECSHIARQLLFQHLVRHYLSQILHGCVSAYCTTPTCLTCNKRLVSRPFRPPTQLTARTLAYYLASQEDPRRGLCPHELKVDPKSFAIEGAEGVTLRYGEEGSGRICDVFPKPRSRTVEETSTERSTFAAGETTEGRQGHVPDVMDTVAKRHQIKKDPKSLGQNLYDTVTMIFFFSKQIPNPASLIASIRSSSVLTQPAAAGAMRHRSTAIADHKNCRNESHTILTVPADGHTAPRAVNGDGSHAGSSPSKPPRNTRRSSKPHVDSVAHDILRNDLQDGATQHLSYSPQKPSVDGTQAQPAPEGRNIRTRAIPGEMFSRASIRSIALQSPNEGKGKDFRRIDSISRLALPVASLLTCDIMDQLKEDVHHHRNGQASGYNFTVDYDANRRYRPAKPFVNRSLFYALSDSGTLLSSFRDQSSEDHVDSPLPHLNSSRLTHAFRDWSSLNGALIFDSLWIAVGVLFRPPPELDTQKSPRLKPLRKDATLSQDSDRPKSFGDEQFVSGRYLSNEEVAHIVMICVHALTSLVPNGWPHTWVQLRKLRGWGVVIPNALPQTDFTEEFVHPWLRIIDELEYEPAIRLADRLLSGIGARMCFEHVVASLGQREDSRGEASTSSGPSSLMATLIDHLKIVERVAITRKANIKANHNLEEDPGWTVTATFMEWLRSIIIKKWGGKAEVNKWNSLGAAFTILEHFHTDMKALNLRKDMFYIPLLNERIDSVQEPIAFLSWEERPNSFHLFQLPFLFPERYLVGYFRAINFTRMHKQIECSLRAAYLELRLEYIVPERNWQPIKDQLHTTFTDFLLLEVSRQDPLTETLDQLWGHEKRMLLKPLKVRIGTQEGEVGFDQGGVTYEYFRIVLSEAFEPDTGMFTVDPQTRMIWFLPHTYEPQWKFEMLGSLFSLAIYNGITLPVTFPLAFYHYLLGPNHPHNNIPTTTTGYIRDGWLTLAQAFDHLLAFDGDVADVFMRDYTFSYEAFGQHVDKEMRAGTPTVTNENREQFVKDYIEWLTVRSVEPQLAAFRRGFLTCFDPHSLHLFTPQSLRSLIEGNTTISIPQLRATTRYEDGYTATHPTIIDFWAIVESYSQDEAKKLLEFVTASDRVPVTGLESVSFEIARAGSDSERLPTSSTCFGKLMLPEYEGREKMRAKLELALGNAKGFGVV